MYLAILGDVDADDVDDDMLPINIKYNVLGYGRPLNRNMYVKLNAEYANSP